MRLPHLGQHFAGRVLGVLLILRVGMRACAIRCRAGQSPEVMWRIYAGCLDGGQEELRRRMEAGFGGRARDPGFAPVLGAAAVSESRSAQKTS
ncbi:hypothetical protein GCM10012284_57450 [Mangrovihabitans endophyticus]|uniref:Uncharacterized protein n=1 Tax=Mangrovihabitans endophyticus TaxID=1751298 RepID=A0A8J3C781_9ACTN|nr:hypothetical protein GCM10012284_57450 [Mangrovihabitans endophyticus]